MAILEILKYPNPILKKKSQSVQKIDGTIRQLVQDMAETMYAAPGVGLAAPQVGHPLRLAVLDITPANQPKNLVVLINPKIVPKRPGNRRGSETKEKSRRPLSEPRGGKCGDRRR
jgi:peptide deformylase